MNIDKAQLNSMTSRQKAIAGVVLLVIVVVIWQVVGMFGGSKKPTPSTQMISTNKSMSANAPQRPAGEPRPTQITQPQMTAEQQSALVKLQQETQEKYVVALNELQMLKLSQQIEATNKDIAASKLATVTAEKGIVDLLTKPAEVETPASFAPGMVTPKGATPQALSGMPVGQMGPNSNSTMVMTTTTEQTTANYVVISVSELLNRWSAVLGYQGKLYSVFVGDVLPADQSIVVAIDKYSVIVEKDGVRRKLSLVPII